MKHNYLRILTLGSAALLLFSQVFLFTLTPAHASVGLNTPQKPQNAAATFVFSRDGNTLASVGEDSWITVVDLASGQERATFAGPSSGVVTDLAFSPDGKTLAGVSEDTVMIWDVASGQERATFAGPSSGVVTDLAFSPDGKTLAGVSDDTHILVLDVESGSQQWVLSSGDGAVSEIAFSPDGTILASRGKDERIKLWDMATGQERLTLANPMSAAVTALGFSPDGLTLASVDMEANITLWDPSSGYAKQLLVGHQDLIKAFAFSPDGSRLASGGRDTQIKLWDVVSGREQGSLADPLGTPVTALVFSPDGNTFVSVGKDTRIVLWDVATGTLRQVLVGHNDFVAEVAFNSNGHTLASVGRDGQVIVWDLPTASDNTNSNISSHSNLGAPITSSSNNLGTFTALEPVNDPGRINTSDQIPTAVNTATAVNDASKNFVIARKPRKHNWKGITALASSPDGKFVGSAGKDGKIRLWNTALEELLILPGHIGSAVTGVVFSADGKRLISVGRDTEVRSWDTITGKQSQALLAHEHPIRTIAASPDGKFLASAGEETRIMVWEAVTGKLTRILNGHSDFVNGLAFSVDGKHLASGGADARILVWEVATGKLLKTLLGHSREVNAVAFSRDGKLLVSTSEDTEVKVWNAATGQKIQSLAGHQAPVRSIAISPNGKTLVSAGEDTQIFTWDIEKGKLSKILTGNTNFINTLVFSPNGHLLVGDENNQITEWDVAKDKKLKIVKPKQPQANSSTEIPVAASPTLSTLTPASTGQTINPIATRIANLSFPSIFGQLLDWVLPAAGAAPLSDPNQGPGGPILVINSASSNFGKYYAEILRNEGFNAFAVADISAVTSTTLAAYDVVILAAMPLSAAQVTMLSNWVNAGGNLIAMRPDTQLAGLLGIAATGPAISNGYVLVDTSKVPGNGIVNQTVQFHGTADRYTLSGASSLATLYTNATTATSNPALTLRSIGANGGQAAAFTYDLATSIVYTRQGNPAWAAQERDGFTPIRSDDKFYGNANGDPQPDWVDLNKVAIPQADEQQRLLANLILEMNLDKKPLPRFWYFPRGKKAVVIMTGDDHGNGGTAGRFDQFKSRSPAGCSVANWECVRGTSYIYTNTPLNDAQAAAYTTDGFEVGIHINTNCADFTPASLEAFYTQQITDWTAKYTSIPPPLTQRHHCIAWSDWLTGAKVQLNHGIRLDTTYYFWPPSWVLNRPGFFTGSGMPMRFSDLDGTLIDAYHAATQMTDESGQQYPFTIDSLLDRALGTQGYYGAFTVNAHTDLSQIPEADAVVTSALARGVPIVSSRQMMDWLDGRNSSSFGSLAWSGNTLSFTVTPGTGANGLQALVPTVSTAGVLTNITRNGGAVTFTTDIIKGVGYAFFTATAGTYVATYAADTAPPLP